MHVHWPKLANSMSVWKYNSIVMMHLDKDRVQLITISICKEVTRLKNRQNRTGKISEVTQETFYTSLDKKSRKTLSACCSSPLLSACQDIYCMEEGRAYTIVHI